MARTLTDMTEEEQQACVGMWADCNLGDITVPLIFQGHASSGHPMLMDTEGDKFSTPAARVTPRFDLMRAWNPDGTPVPANVSYDIQGHREHTDEWVDFFGTRRCTLRRAKRDLAEAREEKPHIKWRLAMRHEPHLMAIPDDYQEPGEGDE